MRVSNQYTHTAIAKGAVHRRLCTGAAKVIAHGHNNMGTTLGVVHRVVNGAATQDCETGVVMEGNMAPVDGTALRAPWEDAAKGRCDRQCDDTL